MQGSRDQNTEQSDQGRHCGILVDGSSADKTNSSFYTGSLSTVKGGEKKNLSRRGGSFLSPKPGVFPKKKVALQCVRSLCFVAQMQFLATKLGSVDKASVPLNGHVS